MLWRQTSCRPGLTPHCKLPVCSHLSLTWSIASHLWHTSLWDCSESLTPCQRRKTGMYEAMDCCVLHSYIMLFCVSTAQRGAQTHCSGLSKTFTVTYRPTLCKTLFYHVWSKVGSSARNVCFPFCYQRGVGWHCSLQLFPHLWLLQPYSSSACPKAKKKFTI